MLRQLTHSTATSYFLFVLVLFTSLAFLQREGNALPFFYKDYPTYPVNGEKHFDRNSENLVLNRIDFATRHIPYPYSFHLWRNGPREAESAERQADNGTAQKAAPERRHGAPYRSQIGVQAWLWAALTEWLDIRDGSYQLQKSLSVLLAALVAAVVLAWIRKNFGALPSLAGLAFLSFSTGINLFAGSLYWSLWLFLLPLAVTCLLEMLGIRTWYALFIATLPAFFVKFLAGYEFISVIVLAAMTPYAWDFFIHHDKAAAFRALIVGASSIGAFLLSLLCYEWLFRADFGLSGIDHLLERSGAWSFFQALEDRSLALGIQATKLLIMNFVDLNGYGIPLGVCLLAIALALIHARNQLRPAEIGFLLFLLLGSTSWLFIQPGHLLFHPRYATLVFSLPFGLFTVSLLARLFEARYRLKKSARPHASP